MIVMVMTGFTPNLLLTTVLVLVSSMMLWSSHSTGFKRPEGHALTGTEAPSYILELIPYMRMHEVNLAPLASVVILSTHGHSQWTVLFGVLFYVTTIFTFTRISVVHALYNAEQYLIDLTKSTLALMSHTVASPSVTNMPVTAQETWVNTDNMEVTSTQDSNVPDFTNAPVELVDPWWVTGITDAEGTFFINSQNTTSELGKKIAYEVKVVQKDHSSAILYALQAYFNCGTVRIDNRRDRTLKWTVTSQHDINTRVIPHFDKYPLVTSKQLDFLSLKEAIGMTLHKEHTTAEGLAKVLKIKAGMNKGRTFKEKWTYHSNKAIKLEDWWLAAFIDGEGHFAAELAYRGAPTRNPYYAVVLSLQIAQSSCEIEVLEAIRKFMNARGAKTTLKPKYDIKDYDAAAAVRAVNRVWVTQAEVVIDFLDQYQLFTRKALDYADWKRLLEMKRNKHHLTPEGRAEMESIKAGMNQGRNK